MRKSIKGIKGWAAGEALRALALTVFGVLLGISTYTEVEPQPSESAETTTASMNPDVAIDRMTPDLPERPQPPSRDENSAPLDETNHPACPGTGNCCVANGTPACDNATCCNTVCNWGWWCCDGQWDDLCAYYAEIYCPALCDGGGDPDCPGSGDCCVANYTPGCEDTACCFTVCNEDAFWWDSYCAEAALEYCTDLCSGNCLPDYVVTAPGTWEGHTCGAGNDCISRSSEEHVYEVTIPQNGTWTFSLCDSEYNTYLLVGTTPGAYDIGFNDDHCGLQSELTATLSAGIYYATIEGYYSTDCGNYILGIFEVPPPDPDIRVEPTSLTFDCTQTQSQPLAKDNSEPLADKLIDADQIERDFAVSVGHVEIIVTLTRPLRTMATTDFDDPASLALLQDEVARRQETVLATLTQEEFMLERRFENFPGFSGAVSRKGLDKLLADPRVEAVEPVRPLELQLRQGIPLINAAVHRSTYNGTGMAIAICDTGIDYTHPMLGNGGFPNSKVIGGYDFGNNDGNPMPVGNAHGTACAGIAAGNLGNLDDYIGGVAYNAKLYALKISPDNNNTAMTSAMVAAWDWCVSHKNDNPDYPIMVISTSFGGGRFNSVCDTYSPAMTAAALNANNAGITLLASSGNDGHCDSLVWPACISHVISVGAVYDANVGSMFFTNCIDSETFANKITCYSSSAGFLDILAPAHNAYTTDMVGVDGYSTGDYYPYFGGTSAACPYAAGSVASLQHAARELTGSYLSPAEVRSLLTATGDPIHDHRCTNTVMPRINLAQAIDAIQPCEGEIVIIHNDGDAPLAITAIDAPAWAILSTLAPLNVPANSSTSLCVSIDCGACGSGDLNGTIVIHSNDPDEPTVNITTQAICPNPGTPPTILFPVHSLKSHGTAGNLALNIPPSGAVEPRSGGPTCLVITFDQDVYGSGGPILEDIWLSAGTVTGVAISGNVLTIDLSGVPDATVLTVSFPGIVNGSDQPSEEILCMRVLLGDVNGEGQVSMTDMVAVRNALNQTVTAENCYLDVDADGFVAVTDMVTVRNNLNATVAPCP